MCKSFHPRHRSGIPTRRVRRFNVPNLLSFILLALLGLSAALPGCCDAGSFFDRSGKRVSIPDNPTRVVSLAPSTTEIIFALGEGHRMVGVTELCNFPAEARVLPKVGGFLHPDLERIVSLEPDLCIVLRDGAPEGVEERLAAFGIPVCEVNPENLQTTIDTIREVGRLFDAEARAEELACDMHSGIGRVKSRVAKVEDHPGVFFQIGVSPIVSAGSNTFINELITTAGGRNLAEGPIPYPRFSREQVLALQPDVIIVTSMTRGQDFDLVKNEWEQWKNLPAVRNRRVFIVDSDLFDRPTPRMVEGLELLARLIHPELF